MTRKPNIFRGALLALRSMPAIASVRDYLPNDYCEQPVRNCLLDRRCELQLLDRESGMHTRRGRSHDGGPNLGKRKR